MVNVNVDSDKCGAFTCAASKPPPLSSINFTEDEVLNGSLLWSMGRGLLSLNVILGGPIMWSLKSQCITSYWSSIETIAYFFRKPRFCVRVSGDRQIDEQTDERTAYKPPHLRAAA